MGTFLHVTHCVSSRDMTKIGLMIFLVHLKFGLRILNFAGAVFEVKVGPANNLHQQNFAGAAPKNTDTDMVSYCMLLFVSYPRLRLREIPIGGHAHIPPHPICKRRSF